MTSSLGVSALAERSKVTMGATSLQIGGTSPIGWPECIPGVSALVLQRYLLLFEPQQRQLPLHTIPDSNPISQLFGRREPG